MVETRKRIIIIRRFITAIIEPMIVSQFFDEGGSFIVFRILFSGSVKIENISGLWPTGNYIVKHLYC
jgi:hypothetical protein